MPPPGKKTYRPASGRNYLDKVKQRNEKDPRGNRQAIDCDGQTYGPGIDHSEKARLSVERQIRELPNQHPEIKNDEDILKEIIEDSKRLREKHESITSNKTFGT